MPSIVLSDVSAAEVFGMTNPANFFAARQDDLELTKGQLESARETLQAVNRNHGFIWTSNVGVMKRLLGPQRNRSLSLVYRMNDAGSKSKPVPCRTVTNEDAEQQQPPGGVGKEKGRFEGAASSVEEEAVRKLLALPEEKLPSSAVRVAYAQFVQTSTLLICWLIAVLQMVRGEDDIPKSGTYPIPVGKPKSSAVGSTAAPVGSGDDNNTTCTSTATQPTASVDARPTAGAPEIVVQAARTRTVHVRRFEIHDAHYSYDSFHEQAKCFFLPEYTQYDARVQRRLLQPAYFRALHDMLSDLSSEVDRLTTTAACKGTGPVNTDWELSPYNAYGPLSSRPACTGTSAEELPEIVFRPPLSSFRFLRDSLRIYLSTCINEDDASALLYYEHVYNDTLTQAREAARIIQRLPKPLDATRRSTAQANPTTDSAGATLAPPHNLAQTLAREQHIVPPGENDYDALHANLAADLDATTTTVGRRLSGWPPTREERGILVSGFEAYWEVRDRIYALKTSLAKDIKQRNRTHMTQVATVAVMKEISHLQQKAEYQERQFQEYERKGTSLFPLWGAVKSSLEALGSAITCKAELDPGDMGEVGGRSQKAMGGEGSPLISASPFHAEKERLLAQVSRLWTVMEVQGMQLEATYSGVFFRGERERWADRMGRLVKKAEGVSVVFSA